MARGPNSIATVRTTSAGPEIYVLGVMVAAFLGTSHNIKAFERVDKINVAYRELMKKCQQC